MPTIPYNNLINQNNENLKVSNYKTPSLCWATIVEQPSQRYLLVLSIVSILENDSSTTLLCVFRQYWTTNDTTSCRVNNGGNQLLREERRPARNLGLLAWFIERRALRTKAASPSLLSQCGGSGTLKQPATSYATATGSPPLIVIYDISFPLFKIVFSSNRRAIELYTRRQCETSQSFSLLSMECPVISVHTWLAGW